MNDHTRGSQSSLSTRSTQGQFAQRRLGWVLVALSLALLGAGATLSLGDPEWPGTEPEQISQSSDDMALGPSLASSPEGHMVLAWADAVVSGTLRNISFVRSDDDGRTWSAPAVISDTAYESVYPDTVIDAEGRQFVAWIELQTTGGLPLTIYETEIPTGGLRNVPSTLPLLNTRPRLAVTADRLHVAFSSWDLLHASRLLTETTWSTATIAYVSAASDGSWNPVLAVEKDGQSLHMVWEDRIGPVQGIMYMSGTVSGADVNWHPPALELSTGITFSVNPNIEADPSGNLHVAWGEKVDTGTETPNHYVRYTRYDITSGTWISPAVRIDASPVRVNQNNPYFLAPDLALKEEDGQLTVCAAWHGFRVGVGVTDAEEILIACSEDNGLSWSSPQNVSRSFGDKDVSILASADFDTRGHLHAAWEEHSDNSSVTDPRAQIFHSHEQYHIYLPLVVRSW